MSLITRGPTVLIFPFPNHPADGIESLHRDKKLESWVKDLGGGGRGEPTIVTPKQCTLFSQREHWKTLADHHLDIRL